MNNLPLLSFICNLIFSQLLKLVLLLFKIINCCPFDELAYFNNFELLLYVALDQFGNKTKKIFKKVSACSGAEALKDLKI